MEVSPQLCSYLRCPGHTHTARPRETHSCAERSQDAVATQKSPRWVAVQFSLLAYLNFSQKPCTTLATGERGRRLFRTRLERLRRKAPRVPSALVASTARPARPLAAGPRSVARKIPGLGDRALPQEAPEAGAARVPGRPEHFPEGRGPSGGPSSAPACYPARWQE